MIRIDPHWPEILRDGLHGLAAEYPHRFSTEEGWSLDFRREGSGLEVGPDPERPGTSVITWDRPIAAFRAVGLVLADLADQAGNAVPGRHREQCPYDSVAVMIDVSRNAVLTVAAATSLLRRLALQGCDRVLLYTEDTYTVPEVPFFGHARGRYTQAEITEIDDAAAALGIELVPCIQTLGHLANVLRWPALRRHRDTDEVLLVDDEDTWQLLREMISAATAPVRSRRIHLGMDETWCLGGGVHRARYGTEPAEDVFLRHLHRLVGLCDELGLSPMIWSDMLLRMGSSTNRTSDADAPIPSVVADQLPPEVRLVYWDYNHNDVDYHRRQIARHRAAGHDPVVAGGVHAWLQKWANLPATLRCLEPQLTAAAEAGTADLMLTIWGNDGNEADWHSALPATQVFGDFAWRGVTRDATTASRFRGCCDASWEDWIAVSLLDQTGLSWNDSANLDMSQVHPGNAASWVLWLDPLLDHLDLGPYEIGHVSWAALAERLDLAAERGLPGDRILTHPARLARVLARKTELHTLLRPAYRAHDRVGLTRLTDDLLPTLLGDLRTLEDSHRALWANSYKTFGWELLERRYAGLASRLTSLQREISTLLADPGHRIETLEAPQLQLRQADGSLVHLVRYDLVAGSGVPSA